MAVTVAESSTDTTKGKMGIDINVLGAAIGGEVGSRKENNEVSRISFIVAVPDRTRAEELRDYHDSQNDFS